MPHFTRVRHTGHRAWAAVAGLLTACALGGLAQPPEEEDPKGGVKKRVVVEDDPMAKPKGAEAGPGTSPDVRLDELVRFADEATHPSVKELVQKHIYPFDRLTTKAGTARIKPIPVARGERLPAQFGVQAVARDGQLGAPEAVNAADVRRIEHFEEVALAEANALLTAKTPPAGLSPTDRLAGAERVLAAVLRFHDYARERNLRRGRGWDEVRKPLADRLRKVRLDELVRFADEA
ncbi:MAG: hypothetical protein ACKODX_05410, partial [Gemmata sp.]